MPLSKRTGNMYDWVTHTWSCLQGQCPHECSYCYVAKGRWTRDNPAYQGPPRLEPNFDKVKLGRDRTIFVAHTSDLFAEGVPDELIGKVNMKCCSSLDNTYVFQTKNPERALGWNLPTGSVVGTTIETNWEELLRRHSKAPSPLSRARAIGELDGIYETFVTIEPAMSFDPTSMVELIKMARPCWVNIGADSKHVIRPEEEPGWNAVGHLLDMLKDANVQVREKSNLDRLRRSA